MTEQERIIVSAYTGYLLCHFDKVHEYIEKKMGRSVWTHEMADKEIQEQIREKCRSDFLALARSDEREKQTETADLLTDTEQRIFLKAIEREREYCKKIHDEWSAGTTINLVKVCDDIKRKVMRGEKSKPKGKWLKGIDCFECSVCGWLITAGEEEINNYCPHCGAAMRGDNNADKR